MATEAYEDTVEGRLVAYADLIYITAQNYLRNFVKTYGFDLKMEAQDITQEVARKTLSNPDIYAPSLGAEFFKRATENLCIDFLRNRHGDARKSEAWGSQAVWMERPEQAGWIDLTAAVRSLPEAQRMAIAERYLGYTSGELSGSAQGSRQALVRARTQLLKKMKQAA